MLTKLFEAEYSNPTLMTKETQVAKQPYRFCANLSKRFPARFLPKASSKTPERHASVPDWLLVSSRQLEHPNEQHSADIQYTDLSPGT